MPDAIKLQESISQITRAIRNMIDLYDADEEKIRFVALQSAHESARDAIKGCLLINSGAAGALLVFIGHLATVKNEVLIVISIFHGWHSRLAHCTNCDLGLILDVFADFN